MIGHAHILIACLVLVIGPLESPSHADTKAEKSDEFIVGKFEGEGISILVRREGKRYAGTLRKADTSVPFDATLVGKELKGAYSIGDVRSGFTAKSTGDALTLKIGLDAYQLKRVTETTPTRSGDFVDLFKSDAIEIQIKKKDGHYFGELRRNGNTIQFTATVLKDTLNGTMTRDGVRSGFVAKINGDKLSLAIGLDSYQLLRNRKIADIHPISGTYAGFGMMIDVQKFGNKVSGVITRGKNQFAFAGKIDDEKVTGHVDLGKLKAPLTIAIVNKRQIKLTMDRPYDLWRYRKPLPMVPERKFTRTINEVLIAESSDILVGSPIASYDNKHVAFITQRDSRRRVSLDGKEGDGFYRVGALVFSPDSKRLGYVAEDNEKFLVVVDGKRGKPFVSLGPNAVQFSPDSRRFAYTANSGSKWHVVVDGKRGQGYDAVSNVTFSKNGAHYGYAARSGDKWFAIIDGKPSKPYARVRSKITFSPNGQRVAFVIADGTKQKAVIDGKAGPAYDAVTGIGFGPHSKRVSYVALKGDADTLVVDGVEGKFYNQVFGASFGPDGKQIVFGAEEGGQHLLVVNGKESNRFDAVAAPLFTSDGRFAYAAMTGRRWSMQGIEDEPNTYDMVAGAQFSPSGNRLAYAAYQSPQWRLVANNQASKPFDQVWGGGFAFSPNGRHIAFGAKLGKSFFLVIDGKEGKPVGEFINGSRVVFENNLALHMIVRKSDRFYRLNVEIVY